MSEIRVLAVRQPFASLIVAGFKKMEIRSAPTNIREKIAIYASNYWYTEKEKKLLFNNFSNLVMEGQISEYEYNYAYSSVLSGGIRGKIIGAVDVVASSQVNDSIEFEIYKNEHFAPIDYFNEGKTYFWHLRGPVKFSSPIPYKPPRGCIVWSKTELPEAKA